MRWISFICLLLSISTTARCADKPNVLFIFADDQSFNTLHSLGNHEIKTPNLDRLVNQGTTFTHAYNMGAWGGAVCMASRMMLISGKYLWHAHADYPQTDKLYRQKNRMWPQLMEGAGYDTYFTGKWHIRSDATKSFKTAKHVRGGMPNQTPEGYNRPIDGQPDKWSPYDMKFGGFWKGGKHWSEVVGDDAVEFLNSAKKSDNPFFMYIAFNAPHDPRQAPKKFVDMYPSEEIELPKSFLPEYPYNEAMASGRKLRDERLAPFPRTKRSVQVNRQEYYAIITHMDQQIGRIYDELEKTGQADNTYIFFSADHGLACGNHGLMGKQNMFDHSVRVPLIAIGPNVPKNKTLDARVYLQDIMATSLELADAKKPDYVQFTSLMPFIKGEKTKGLEAVYGAYIESQRMVTMGDFKLILYPKISQAILYNVANDPEELKDLLTDGKHDAKAKELFGRLLALQKETGDKLDLLSTFPKLK